MNARRPDPDALLRLARRENRRGKLKVYLGLAAGVGKTYRMLADAQALKRRGVDAVIGFIETHGRAETDAMVGDLEKIPPKLVDHRGVRLQEMDREAILRRRPDLVIVDELPHTNAPGSKNEKRWQDVAELVGAGVSVMTALNVQHLEGVQDVVERATGIEVMERVPDRLIREADTVINVDLPVSELRERISQGKVYAPERAEHALNNFFREEILTRLRELALLQTAEHTERESFEHEMGEAAGAFARVAVALPFDPAVARQLILKGSRVAGRMNTRWFGIYVRRRRDQPENMTAEEHRLLTENVELAMSLGANIVFRRSEDVAGSLLEFVREQRIGLLVVGRASRSAWIDRIAPGIVSRLQRAAGGFDLLVADPGDG